MSVLDDDIDINPPNFKISMEEILNDDTENDVYESDSSTDMNLAPDNAYDLEKSHESMDSTNDEWMDDDDEGVCVLEIDVSKLASIHEDPAFYALSKRCVDDSGSDTEEDEDQDQDNNEFELEEAEFIDIGKKMNRRTINTKGMEDDDENDENDDDDDDDDDSQLDADVELVRQSLELAAVMEREGKHGDVEAVLSMALNGLHGGKKNNNNQKQRNRQSNAENDVVNGNRIIGSSETSSLTNIQLDTSMTSVDSSVNSDTKPYRGDEVEVVTPSTGIDVLDTGTETDNSNGTTSSDSRRHDTSKNDYNRNDSNSNSRNSNNNSNSNNDGSSKNGNNDVQLECRQRTSTEYTDVSVVTCVSGNGSGDQDAREDLQKNDLHVPRCNQNNSSSSDNHQEIINAGDNDYKVDKKNLYNLKSSSSSSSSSSSRRGSSSSGGGGGGGDGKTGSIRALGSSGGDGGGDGMTGSIRVFSESAFASTAFSPNNSSKNNSKDPYDVYDPFQEVQCFHLPVIFEPGRTGFEATKDLCTRPGTIIAGKFRVTDYCASADQAAFSRTLQCIDLKVAAHKASLTEAGKSDEAEKLDPWVCLKVIKNNKDYIDQSLDEIKLLHYINSNGDANQKHVLELRDFFYYKEHLVIATELLCDNLYAFSRYIREGEGQIEPFFTLPRLKRITFQIIDALDYIHSLGLIHCDVKPENIVIKSYSRCEVKLIDFGATCYITDRLSTYIQSRSYRAPEVILGALYDHRIDVWSYGAVLAELFTGYVLFQSKSVPRMLARITGVLGPLHPSFLQVCRDVEQYLLDNNTFFYEAKTISSAARVGSSNKDIPISMKIILPKVTSLSQRLHLSLPTHLENTLLTEDDVCAGLCTRSEREESQFLDFVRSSLTVDWRRRPSCHELLDHAWLRDTFSEQIQELVYYTDTAGDPNNEIADSESDDNDNDDDHDGKRKIKNGRSVNNTGIVHVGDAVGDADADANVDWDEDDSAEFENILTQE